MATQALGSTTLSFDHTVDRHLVHKHALDEAFITGCENRPDDVLLAAVLPRAHSLYNEFPAQDRLPDLCLITEVCRQACFVVAHLRFEVPTTGNRYQFLLQEIDSAFVAVEQLPPTRPIELVLECSIDETRRRGRELSASVWRFRINDRTGNVHVADVRMRMTWIDRTDWRRMRASMRSSRCLNPQPEPPTPPASPIQPSWVGRRTPDNVTLASVHTRGTTSEAVARIGRRHPVLFDHPIDHIYAMVQLEACRQLSLLTDARHQQKPADETELASFSARFESVAELDLPLLLRGQLEHAESSDNATHHVDLYQDQRRVSEFHLETRPIRQFTTPHMD